MDMKDPTVSFAKSQQAIANTLGKLHIPVLPLSNVVPDQPVHERFECRYRHWKTSSSYTLQDGFQKLCAEHQHVRSHVSTVPIESLHHLSKFSPFVALSPGIKFH